MQRHGVGDLWLTLGVALLATTVGAHPTKVTNGPAQVTCGPAQHGCGPAIVVGASVGAGTPVNLPATDASDTNCPTTLIAQTGATPGAGQLNATKTCATGSNAHGYDVQSISLYVAGSAVNDHTICTVYSYPSPYTSGTSSVSKVAAGCDSAQSVPLNGPNAYVTMAVAGPCHLAPSTRYFLGCNGQNTANFGYVSCSNCWQILMSQAFPALPTPWVANNQLPGAIAVYATVAPTP